MSHMCNSTDKCAIPSSDPALYPTIEFSNCTRSEKKVCARGKSTFEELFIEHRLNETLNGVRIYFQFDIFFSLLSYVFHCPISSLFTLGASERYSFI